jgi:hypothetical protein
MQRPHMTPFELGMEATLESLWIGDPLLDE